MSPCLRWSRILRRSPPDSPRELSDKGRDRNIHAQSERASKLPAFSTREPRRRRTGGLPVHRRNPGSLALKSAPAPLLTRARRGGLTCSCAALREIPGVGAARGPTACRPLALRAFTGATFLFTFGAECSTFSGRQADRFVALGRRARSFRRRRRSCCTVAHADGASTTLVRAIRDTPSPCCEPPTSPSVTARPSR